MTVFLDSTTELVISNFAVDAKRKAMGSLFVWGFELGSDDISGGFNEVVLLLL
jgi:hypothetical protein